ncbi:MAG TPA: hypothetical protein DIT04_13995 [Dysgonomonas sp.]|nr:hypothetical protein [Dysgonomonas sp.]
MREIIADLSWIILRSFSTTKVQKQNVCFIRLFIMMMKTVNHAFLISGTPSCGIPKYRLMGIRRFQYLYTLRI